VVHNLLHVGHCLLISVEYAWYHHPFLRVLWFGHISSRSRSRSWLIISDLQEVARAVCSEVDKLLDSAARGGFELAFKFKLLTIGVPVPSSPLCLTSLLSVQFSYSWASFRESFS